MLDVTDIGAPRLKREPQGHWRELAMRTRHDHPFISTERQLVSAVLADDEVQDALITIGLPPLVSGQTTPTQFGRRVTQRSRRIYVTWAALRGVLTYDEIDRYSREISKRREDGTWPKGSPPFGGYRVSEAEGRDGGGRRKPRGPDAATITTAANALAACLKAARGSAPDGLGHYDCDCLRRVLAFIGKADYREAQRVPRYRSADPSAGRAAEAAKKRSQRQRRADAAQVAVERERLDAEVAAGRLYRWTQDDSDRLADQWGVPHQAFGTVDPGTIYTSPPER